MADTVTEMKGAEIFPIQVNETYPPDFEDMTGIAKDDSADNKQFTFKIEPPDLDDYDTIYFGVPVVAYFSAESGRTASVAKSLASAVGADLFEIKP